MPGWQGKSKGTALGYRIFVAVLKKGGLFPAYFLLRFVALYYFLFSFKSSKPVYQYFRIRLGFGKWVSLAKLYRNYYLFGQTLIDKVVVMAGIPHKFTFDFDGEENLHRMVEMGKGGLLLSAHIGNWEIAGHLLIRLGTRIHIVIFDGEEEQIKQYIDSVSGKKNVNLILLKPDLSHIYEISDALKNNELVCMHADRFLEGNKTASTLFLGEKAKFPIGPFVLASLFNVPVSFVFAMKETNLHYHFYASPIKEFPDKAKAEGIQEMVDDFAGQMENKVKLYPEQWYNYYNFWQ
jgi:predicted LPLAT superfamily acyltransferase